MKLRLAVRVERLVGFGPRMLHDDAVKRRNGGEHPSFFDQWSHVTEEEGEQQRTNVGAVNIGVAHQDHLAVARGADVERPT